MVAPAAYVFCAILAALAVFQALLAAGAPLGRFAWGGQHRTLPMPLRIGSVVSIGLYGLMGWVIVERAGIASLVGPSPAIRWFAWAIVGYSGLGILMNLISRSVPERLVMTPTATALFVSALIVALT